MTNWMIIATISAPLLALLTGFWLERKFESRPKLITFYGHVSAHQLQGQMGQPNTVIHTHSIVVRNAGRRPAHNVRIGHNFLPQNFVIHPPTEFNVVNFTNGAEIVIPTLAPEQQITISYLYFPPITWNQINTQIHCDEGIARVLNVLPPPQLPNWVIKLLQSLIFLGLVTFIFILIQTGIFAFKLYRVVYP